MHSVPHPHEPALNVCWCLLHRWGAPRLDIGHRGTPRACAYCAPYDSKHWPPVLIELALIARVIAYNSSQHVPVLIARQRMLCASAHSPAPPVSRQIRHGGGYHKPGHTLAGSARRIRGLPRRAREFRADAYARAQCAPAHNGRRCLLYLTLHALHASR